MYVGHFLHPFNRLVQVHNKESSLPWGLAEYMNPFSVRNLTIEEACKVPSSHLEKKKIHSLKRGHNQIECQLYCFDRQWCDFCSQNREVNVERMWRNTEWWITQLAKLGHFYFQLLLSELACPQYHKARE